MKQKILELFSDLNLSNEGERFLPHIHMQQKGEFFVMPKVRGHFKAVACKIHYITELDNTQVCACSRIVQLRFPKQRYADLVLIQKYQEG